MCDCGSQGWGGLGTHAQHGGLSRGRGTEAGAYGRWALGCFFEWGDWVNCGVSRHGPEAQCSWGGSGESTEEARHSTVLFPAWYLYFSSQQTSWFTHTHMYGTHGYQNLGVFFYLTVYLWLKFVKMQLCKSSWNPFTNKACWSKNKLRLWL